jgi:hypothetical protein
MRLTAVGHPSSRDISSHAINSIREHSTKILSDHVFVSARDFPQLSLTPPHPTPRKSRDVRLLAAHHDRSKGYEQQAFRQLMRCKKRFLLRNPKTQVSQTYQPD